MIWFFGKILAYYISKVEKMNWFHPKWDPLLTEECPFFFQRLLFESFSGWECCKLFHFWKYWNFETSQCWCFETASLISDLQTQVCKIQSEECECKILWNTNHENVSVRYCKILLSHQSYGHHPLWLSSKHNHFEVK